jgi:hypothetical protein
LAARSRWSAYARGWLATMCRRVHNDRGHIFRRRKHRHVTLAGPTLALREIV